MLLKIKKYDNKELNVSIDAHIDGKQNIWFKGKDVAMALGYKDTDDTIRKHVEDKYKAVFKTLVNRRGIQQTIFITEPGLYSLIFEKIWRLRSQVET